MTRETKIFLGAFLAVLIAWLAFRTIDRSNLQTKAAQARIVMLNQHRPDTGTAFDPSTVPYFSAEYVTLGILGVLGVVGAMEFGVLRLFSLTRLGAIVRVTYYEALLQPFSLILLGTGIAAIVVAGYVPYFTLQEDPKMFRDVATQLVLLVGLVLMVFASGKVVDEEIENRTMLTLMSKPIGRWQVIIGKFLGVLCLVALAVAVLGIVTMVFSWLYYVDDKRIDFSVSGGAAGIQAIILDGTKTVLALVPYLFLIFLQLATLAAISIALSTRYGMALNYVVIIVVYLLANLTRYVNELDLSPFWKDLAIYASFLLPNLNNFDIQPRLIYGTFTMGAEPPMRDSPTLGAIWAYVGLVSMYGAMYIGAALAAAVALFRTRELS